MKSDSPSDASLRRKLLFCMTLLAMLGAAIAGGCGYWLARGELEKRLLDDSAANIARIIRELKLPTDSERLVQNLRQITDCDIVFTRGENIARSTLADIDYAQLKTADGGVFISGGMGFRVASKTVDDDTILWILLPQEVVGRRLRQASGMILALTFSAGLLAVIVAIVIANSYGRLMRKISDADRRLARAEATAMAGKLSSSVVHELRNPLSGIRMNAQILAEESQGNSKATDNECLQMIIREIDRIDVFLRSLTDLGDAELTKHDSGQPLVVVLQQIAELMSGRCQHANVSLKLVIDDSVSDSLPLPCPETHLRQILVNLLTNALEASPAGGSITLTAKHQDSELALAVSDEGPGVHPKDGEDIFAPFVSHKPNGCGIGLHISRQIAEKYHARLEWRNLQWRGAEFILTFPA